MPAEAAIEELLDLVPELRGDRTVTELVGGLTNTNYKVVTDAGAFVVRVSAKDGSMLAIDRENEYLNSVSAAEAGVGAEVVDYVPQHSLLVLEFIEGQTQSAEDLRRGDKLEMVAAACRRLHSAAPFRDDFNMFRIQHRYLGLVRDLIADDRAAGLMSDEVPLEDLAYTAVRITESYIHTRVITGEEPDARRAEAVLRVLLR